MNSFDDWKTRLFGVYTPERSEYFIEARKLMTAQQNMFLAPAPISALNPIWGDERDWLPGHPHFTDVSDATNLLVVESTIDFVPGGLPAYWAAYQTPGVLDDPLTTARLVACLYTLVGQQHRVILYRWFRGTVEAQEHQLALEGSPHWRPFVAAYRAHVVQSWVAYLRPSPVKWLQSLFAAVGPYN